MEGPHRREFEKAMQKEIADLEKHGTWQGTLCSAISLGSEVVPLMWAFRIKRLPNGDFDKFKACLAIGSNFRSEWRETFAPVVKWSTIGTVLVFALKMGLKTILCLFRLNHQRRTPSIVHCQSA